MNAVKCQTQYTSGFLFFNSLLRLFSVFALQRITLLRICFLLRGCTRSPYNFSEALRLLSYFWLSLFLFVEVAFDLRTLDNYIIVYESERYNES